ncbi:MAG: GNAT family N-acetyltransferase [Pseudomonadota bacterium]
MTKPDIAPLAAVDLPAVRQVLAETELFPPDLLDELSAGFLSGQSTDEWLTVRHSGEVVGFVYAVEEQMADRVWNMLALAVRPISQGAGAGGELVGALEHRLTKKGARLMIVDTSGTEQFARTRRFYRQQGYTEVARLPDYWENGDDKVTFLKRLSD